MAADAAAVQQKPKPVEVPARDFDTGFDYRTHIRDAKTGRLIILQPYSRHSNGEQVLLERPIGSGNCFAENGEPAGRWKFETAGKEAKWTKLSDTHDATAKNPSVNPVEDLRAENEALKAERAARDAELAAREVASQPKAQKHAHKE